MRRPTRLACIAMSAFTFSTIAQGSVIYVDGLTHTANGPSADVLVSNATTLNITSGAAIVGPNDTVLTPPAIGLSATGNSIINVSGGSITGGSGTFYSGATGFSAVSSTVAITSGTMTGGNAPPGGSAGVGLSFISSTTPLTIGGGTFQGGNHGLGGDGAQVILSGPSASANISGGQFSAGSPDVNPFTGISTLSALSLIESKGASATISGGQFSGGFSPGLITLDLFNNSTLTFLGTGITAMMIADPSFPTIHYLQMSGTYATGGSFSDTILLAAPNEQIVLSGTSSSFTITGMDPVSNVVPEPVSLLMYTLGLVVVAGLARYRRRAA